MKPKVMLGNENTIIDIEQNILSDAFRVDSGTLQKYYYY